MFRKKLVALMMVTVLAASFTACGDKGASTVGNEETSVASTEATQQQTTKAIESAEELSKKAEEAKASMAAAVEKAAQEEASKKAASKAEAESIAVAQTQATEAPTPQAVAAVSVQQQAGSDDEVVTVVDSYGIDSARAQYSANYGAYVELINLTNQLRASLGVAPLSMDENMCIAACKKSVDYYVADYYDGANHTMIDGRRWQALFEDFNIVATARAENLAKGPAYKTASQMYEGWKNSSIHYNNMINPAYTRVGVGSCGYVWFMDLAD